MRRRTTQAAKRVTTTLRIERGEHIPAEGETIIMERALSHHITAVTVHRINKRREHPDEPGVWLLDANVTMRDIADPLGLMVRPQRCALCGQTCPKECRCPECDKSLCDACYESHFATNCTPEMANPDIDDLITEPAESEAQP